MCLNGLKCAQSARKLHFESTQFKLFLGDLSPQTLVKLGQIIHVRSSTHPFERVNNSNKRNKIKDLRWWWAISHFKGFSAQIITSNVNNTIHREVVY